MATKRELEDQAKALILSNPEEAVKLYHEIYDTFQEQFNNWDAFYAIKALRASTINELKWASELVEKYKEEKVCNLYGWLVFDKCIKGKNRSEILSYENYISKLPEICLQKNLKEEISFPCPTTISVLKLCDAHAENLFNARKINDLLNGLDYRLLSDKAKTIETQERGEVELSSDLEKYFALKTKALFKLGEYESCIEFCNIGLNTLSKFHYNNDLWFRMRIALSEDKIGNHIQSELLFQELLSSKAGSDKWFLYRDIAEVYFEQGDFEKAWKFAVDAAFYGNEPHFLIGLYLLQARILFKLERSIEGKILAELIAAITIEQNWNDKMEYTKLFNYYKIDKSTLPSTNEIHKVAIKFWQKERYGDKPKQKGTVISIHKNGKIGRIKSVNGVVVGFHKKDLVKRFRNLNDLIDAKVEFYEMKSFDGKSVAENIIVVEQKSVSKPIVADGSLIGQTMNGKVRKALDFGIFISLDSGKDGLLHKNALPRNMQSDYMNLFTNGKRVKVQIDRITEKGIQLKFIDFG